MKSLFFLFILVFSSFALSGQSFLVETELFREKGGWITETQFIDQMGSAYLLAHGLGESVDDAYTTVIAPETGAYHLWIRTKDWIPDANGPGVFEVWINENRQGGVYGGDGVYDWHWVYIGKINLPDSPVIITLKDLTGFGGRCDALFFSKKKNHAPPDTIEERNIFAAGKKGIPVDEGHFDLIVSGGGVAGICCAVQAARFGLKVALINNRPVLGGTSSSEIRVSVSGDTFRNKYPVLGRIVREIDNGYAGIIGMISPELYRDEDRRKIVLNEKNIYLFENMHVSGIEMKSDTVSGLYAINLDTYGSHFFHGDLFADCTGDAVVGRLAGADHRYGRESRAETGEPSAPLEPDNLVMGSSNQWYAEKQDRESSFPVQPWMLKFTNDYHFELIHSVWNWESGFNSWHTVRDAEIIRDHNIRAIYSNWAYIKTDKPEKFGLYKLQFLSPMAGKRESYRLMGDFILREQDIVNKVDYPDAIVTTTWGIDLHYPEPENAARFPGQEFIAYAVHPSKEKDVYTFPYRCLYSRNIPNLFMAGRNISVTHVALGTVRVQRCTGMMGEVVGLAAYLCRKHNCYPRAIYQKHLQSLLDLCK
jgi:hypothetical protein